MSLFLPPFYFTFENAVHWSGSEFKGFAKRFLTFLLPSRGIKAPKKSKQKKGRPKTWSRKAGLPSLPHLPSAVTKTRFAQTVCDLHPQSAASLGCVLTGSDKKPFQG